MNSNKKTARFAGFLYFLMIICGIFSLVYFPSKFYVLESAVETHSNITSNEFLFKVSILSDLCMSTIFIFLSLSLYKLLKQANNNIAIIMVILVLISVSISYVNLIPKLDIISLINNTTETKSIDINGQSEKLLTILKSHYNGFTIIQIFWGLWLLPFGYLVLKSGFIPKVFGVLLILGCFGYLTDFFGYFLFPKDYGKTIIPTIASLPHALGEIGICLWLLIMGTNKLNFRNENE